MGLMLLAHAMSASPAAAYKHLGANGTTGTHSLTDNRSSPGADCQYRFFDRGTQWELRRINVRPPNVEAAPAQADPEQQVGWNFTVERRKFNAFTDPGPWVHRYTSPTQKRMTDADHDAEFTPMDVSVQVPDDASSDVWYKYRVVVEVFWYRDNGSVSGSAMMRNMWFKSFFDDDSAKQRRSCFTNFDQPPT
jgi:hypothetical protein